MKRLPVPEKPVLQAVMQLKHHPAWALFDEFLFDFCEQYMFERFKARKDPMEDTLDKGALQLLDDLRAITTNAEKWYTDKLKKEGKGS